MASMLIPEFNPKAVVEVETEWSRRRKASRTGHFVFGPIAVRDIKVATELGGSCLAVLLMIIFRRDVLRSEAVTLPQGALDEFGVNADAKLRALKRLEQAKLIDVERSAGCTAVIKLRAKKRRGRK
jgi:hypothetical protein